LKTRNSIQAVIRQVVQMVLQKRLEQKTASLLLYALQIASSNLKRMELEKPQPEQVVTDLERCWILRTHGKPPSPAPARPRAKLHPARHQPIAIKKLARSAAKTFRPAQSMPVIAPDQRPRIAFAKAARTEAICNLKMERRRPRLSVRVFSFVLPTDRRARAPVAPFSDYILLPLRAALAKAILGLWSGAITGMDCAGRKVFAADLAKLFDRDWLVGALGEVSPAVSPERAMGLAMRPEDPAPVRDR